MNIKIIFLLFWLYSLIGWVMETTLVSLENKKFINRGFFIGPYCPIYGTGAILLLFLSPYKDNPLIIFLVSIIICSIVEYLTSYVMEQIYKVRWWDYSNRYLNINGRICLFNSICFGLLGMIMVTFLNPFFISYIDNLSKNIQTILVFLTLIITLIDVIITFWVMFDIRKTIVNYKEKTLTNLFKKNQDNTENISKRVKEILKRKTLIHKHLSISFSNFKIYKNYLSKDHNYLKLEKLESITIISTLTSIIVGYIIGKIVNRVGLMICLSFTISVIIIKIINKYKRKNE